MELQARLMGLPSHILHLKKHYKKAHNRINNNNNNKNNNNSDDDNNNHNINQDNNNSNKTNVFKNGHDSRHKTVHESKSHRERNSNKDRMSLNHHNNMCTDNNTSKISNNNSNNNNHNNNNNNTSNNTSNNNNNNNTGNNDTSSKEKDEADKLRRRGLKGSDKGSGEGGEVVKEDVEGNKVDKADSNGAQVLGSRRHNDKRHLRSDTRYVNDRDRRYGENERHAIDYEGGHGVDAGGEEGLRGSERAHEGSSSDGDDDDDKETFDHNENKNEHLEQKDGPGDGSHADKDFSFSVHSISTILAGSHFGPYECCLTSASNNNCSLKVSIDGKEKDVGMTTSNGLWLTLLTTKKRSHQCNLRLSLAGSSISARVTKNIPPGMELVAEKNICMEGSCLEKNIRKKDSVETRGTERGCKNRDDEAADQQVDEDVYTKKEAVSPADSRVSPSMHTSPTHHTTNTDANTSTMHASFFGHLPPSHHTLNHSSEMVNSFSNHAKLSSSHALSKLEDKGMLETSFRSLRHPSTTNTLLHNTPLPESKVTYELIHECMFCGVKFSSGKTLQAHLANYCSKKPALDSSNLLLHLMLMQDQLRYRYLFNQQQLNTSDELSVGSAGVNPNESLKVKKEKEESEEGLEVFKSKEFVVNSSNKTSIEKNIYSKNNSVIDTPSFKRQLPASTKDSSKGLLASSPLFNTFPFPFLPFLPFKYPPSSLLEAIKTPLSFSDSVQESNASEKRLKLDQQYRAFEAPIDLSGKKASDAPVLCAQSTDHRSFSPTSNGFQMYENFKKNHLKSHSELGPSEAFTPPKLPSNPLLTRCVECNIVFFKAENYLAHKQHYCASRNNLPNDIDLPSRNSIKDNQTPKKYSRSERHAEVSKKDTLKQEGMNGLLNDSKGDHVKNCDEDQTTHVKQSHLQYFCVPCKIKFSSVETLKAHKEYYCSSRNSAPACSESKENHLKKEAREFKVEDDELKGKIKEENSKDDKQPPSRQDSRVTCVSCMGAFNSEQSMALHLCTPSSRGLLFQCSHCEQLSQGEDRLLEHLRTHAPSKVFRCLLCGYRGNTVRGMRMHGKMHNDAGESFTDDSMVEVEELPSFPKKFKSMLGPSLPAFMLSGKHASRPSSQQYLMQAGFELPEIELIRMKNEPYKRRRSRKAYEKSEYMPKKVLDENFACPKCLTVFSNDSHLQIHMLSHMSSSSPAPQPKLSIKSKPILPLAIKTEFSNEAQTSRLFQKGMKVCSDVNNNHITPPLAKRFKLSPPEVNGDILLKNKTPKDTALFYNPPPFLHHSPGSKALHKAFSSSRQHSTSLKGSRSGDEDATEHSKLSSFPLAEKDLSKYCKQCNINFMYTSTYLAHKKYYCGSRDAEDETDEAKS